MTATAPGRRVLLMLGWYYPESLGGTEQYVRILARDLKSLGWEPVVMAPSVDDSERRYLIEDIPVYRYAISHNPTKKIMRGYDEPRYFPAFRNMIDEIKPDIVNMNTYNWNIGNYHAEHLKNLGLPFVLTIHVPDINCVRGTMMRFGTVPCDGEMVQSRCTECMLDKLGAGVLTRKLLGALPAKVSRLGISLNGRFGTGVSLKEVIRFRLASVRRLFELSDRLVTVSEWMRDVLILNGVEPEKIACIKKGLPEDWKEFRSKLADKSCRGTVKLGYTGRITRFKGIHVLVDGIKGLGPDKRVELHIYGRVNDKESALYHESLKRRAEGCANIYFHGEIDTGNRVNVFNSLDMVAVPSVWFENLPYVVSEAFAAGLPVMGSDIPGVSEMIEDNVNGMLVDPGNAEAWSCAIGKIAENPVILKKLSSGIPPVKLSIEASLEMSELLESAMAARLKYSVH